MKNYTYEYMAECSRHTTFQYQRSRYLIIKPQPPKSPTSSQYPSKKSKSLKTHLRILEPELLGELLAVGLADVLLQLEPLLQASPLQIRENCSAHHAAARLAPSAARPREAQAHACELAQAGGLHGTGEAPGTGPTRTAQLVIAASWTSHCE